MSAHRIGPEGGPRITSIQQPLYQIGYDSILSIDGMLQGSITTPINKFYQTTLEEHETVCFCPE
ncbi:MAG: hypothetical protein LBQ71_11635 [Hungatella sp.]|jgi:hypothetical protein|nr:hypothetical protein [Hungatella sp.]